jgi:predicted Zn-dependent protease
MASRGWRWSCWTAGLALLIGTQPPASGQEPCALPRVGEPLDQKPLLRSPAVPAPQPLLDYRHRLQTTPSGWPTQSTWCVWVEPPETLAPASPVQSRWQAAIDGALEEWRRLLPIVIVPEADRAQVTVWRRRPPLGRDAAGRARASHGRAILTLQRRPPGATPSVEPRVVVLISPDQRLEAIQATALHELGHAFGLWGHSEDPADAMAIAPGSRPIQRLSERDRATVRWLYQQATPMRSDP